MPPENHHEELLSDNNIARVLIILTAIVMMLIGSQAGLSKPRVAGVAAFIYIFGEIAISAGVLDWLTQKAEFANDQIGKKYGKRPFTPASKQSPSRTIRQAQRPSPPSHSNVHPNAQTLPVAPNRQPKRESPWPQEQKRPFPHSPIQHANPNWLAEVQADRAPYANWLEMAQEHYGKHPFLLGYGGNKTAVYVDFNTKPHYLVGGMTGHGKTSSFIRPIVAMAAASGMFQVLMIDTSGRNFRLMSDHHPNVHVLAITPARYETALEAVYAEIARRDRWLSSLPGYITEITEVEPRQRPPRILVVIDEYSNVYSEFPAVGNSLRKIVREGRGMGVHAMVIAQRMTSDGIDTTSRSQMNKATFHTPSDEERYALPGSSSLGLGQALVSWNQDAGAVQCLHAPKEAIITYLKNAPAVPDYGFPLWLPDEFHRAVLPKSGAEPSENGRSTPVPLPFQGGNWVNNARSTPVPTAVPGTVPPLGTAKSTFGTAGERPFDHRAAAWLQQVPAGHFDEVPDDLAWTKLELDEINEIAALTEAGLSITEIQKQVRKRRATIVAVRNYVKDIEEDEDGD